MQPRDLDGVNRDLVRLRLVRPRVEVHLREGVDDLIVEGFDIEPPTRISQPNDQTF